MCAFVCVRARTYLSLDGLKFKIELYKYNETVSYKLSLACAGVTFGQVELTVINVDLAILAGSVRIYRYMQLCIFAIV